MTPGVRHRAIEVHFYYYYYYYYNPRNKPDDRDRRCASLSPSIEFQQGEDVNIFITSRYVILHALFSPFRLGTRASRASLRHVGNHLEYSRTHIMHVCLFGKNNNINDRYWKLLVIQLTLLHSVREVRVQPESKSRSVADHRQRREVGNPFCPG